MLVKTANLTLKGFVHKIFREGSSFQEYYSLIKKLDHENESVRADFQLEALKQSMRFAKKHIPYWRKTFHEYDINPEKLYNIEDLKRLPLLTKKYVMHNWYKFVPEKYSKFKYVKACTSGTTGTPGVFLRDLNSINFENAILWYLRDKIGIKKNDKLLMLRGDQIVSPTKKKPPFWAWNLFQRQLFLSTYHLIPNYKQHILTKAQNFNPIGAFAYPSSTYVLANWCASANIKLPFKHLHTSSETILPYQKDIIRTCLKGKWLDTYGQAERVSFMASIDSVNYQEYTEYGVLEYIPVDTFGYEIIGSTIHNRIMPLFRYKTGDYVQNREYKGENRPIVQGLQGRIEDFITLSDGRKIGRLDHIFKGVDNISEAQIYQKDIHNIVLKVIPLENYSQNDEQKLFNKARNKLTNLISIKIEYVHKIERTDNGKFKFVISDIT